MFLQNQNKYIYKQLIKTHLLFLKTTYQTPLFLQNIRKLYFFLT